MPLFDITNFRYNGFFSNEPLQIIKNLHILQNIGGTLYILHNEFLLTDFSRNEFYSNGFLKIALQVVRIILAARHKLA